MSALKQVFVRVHFRYDRDRYAEDLERFAAWLLTQGYPNQTARLHLFRVQQVLHAIGFAPGTPVQADVLQRVFRRLERRRWKDCHSHPTYAGYLRSIGRLIEPPPVAPTATEVLLGEFSERLARRRGLASSTISLYRSSVSDFLRRSLPRGSAVGDLKPRSLERYIELRTREIAWHTLQYEIKCIQAFLRDCHERGLLPRRLDQIDLPRRFRAEQPPRALPWNYIERLLASIDRTRHAGARDHTILYLMAHYGLRTGEIVDLRLDSINWQARTLAVWRAKTHSITVLPLRDQTVKVLKAYLKTARPRSTLPHLFLSANAPVKPMSKFSVSFVFYSRARRSGLPISGYTAYSLRHAFAMRLFQHGVGMKAIGDLMGHRNLISTSVYLRLQADMLREVALAVPDSRQEVVP
jgi:site-specific recombinase XerD